MHRCTHTHIHTSAHTHLQMHSHTFTCTCTHALTQRCTHIHMHTPNTCPHTCTYTQMHTLTRTHALTDTLSHALTRTLTRTLRTHFHSHDAPYKSAAIASASQIRKGPCQGDNIRIGIIASLRGEGGRSRSVKLRTLCVQIADRSDVSDFPDTGCFPRSATQRRMCQP